jgi:redox-sensitive bicupin YhaK (pirin superfamily)
MSLLGKLGCGVGAVKSNRADTFPVADAGACDGGMKSVRRIMSRPQRHWVGDGFHVYPVFAELAFKQELSPWLMFDYAAPKEFPPTSRRRGVGQHPHRGFETVTLAWHGEVEHGDSVGNSGVIGSGDVQWMTAGRGIIHEEFHSSSFAETGGTFEMCQFWLNLPAKDKMTPPGYQSIVKDQIPNVPLAPVGISPQDLSSLQDSGEGAIAKVIAGELNGTRGPAVTFSPVELWDIEFGSMTNTPFELHVPAGHNCIVFVRRGTISVGAEGSEQVVESQGVALMHREGSTLRVTPTTPGSQIIVLGGEPLNEPIANSGPFVMNTEEELAKAREDYMMGRMGK